MLSAVATGIPRELDRAMKTIDDSCANPPIRTLRHVGDVRAALSCARRTGVRRAGSEMAASGARTTEGMDARRVQSTRVAPAIGLVPTMGALHEGHMSLIRRARAECDLVIVSLFVNPSQFDERADLDRYPRREREDAALAERAGADLLFAPSIEEVYPPGFATSVEVLGVTGILEGEARGAAHFRGVSTVVTKLLCMTAPDVAYFGQKDAQQVAVIRRLVRDLNLPVRIAVCPTVREPDGLALSSRNALLDPHSRARALALPAALDAARELAGAGERSAKALIEAARTAMDPFAVAPEYLAIVEPDTFEPIFSLERPALLVLAARVGGIRLIDNVLLEPRPTPVTLPDRARTAAACSA
jgi:pantoate--beta-alanine ligase